MADDATALRRLEDLVGSLRVHPGKSGPSPHKALLLLWATARLESQSAERLFSYHDAALALSELLAVAGHEGRPRPWYPFVRLRTSGFWEIVRLPELNASGDVSGAKPLLDARTQAGFLEPFDRVLRDSAHRDSVQDLIARRWLQATVGDACVLAAKQLVRSSA